MREAAPTARIAAELSEHGIAVTTAGTLFGEYDANLVALQQRAEKFAAGDKVRMALADYQAGVPRPTTKQFLVKHQDRQRFHQDDPLLILGARLGQHFRDMRLYSADLWYVLPHADGRKREWSHNWHRDPEGNCVLKVTLYLRDVDGEAGPFQYVPGSHRSHLEMCQPGNYAADQEAVSRLPHVTVTGPAGTLILADTSGIHRGGYTQAKSRLNAVWTYLPTNHPHRNLYEVVAV